MESTTAIQEDVHDETPIGVCRVCELVDGDTSEKPVLYCSICDSWICDDCRPNIRKRAIATFKNAFTRK